MVDVDLVVRAPRLVTPDGEVSGCVAVSGGSIVAVDALDARVEARVVVELAPDEVLLPGAVDSHVHINEPGRADWEGFSSATRAAAAGGVTTLIDMPLNSLPPTVDLAALNAKRAAATGRIFVDVGFWGGAVPGNLGQLQPLHDAGVFGFKCFLAPSGVEEFPPLNAAQLETAMRRIASISGLLVVHAEDHEVIERAPPARGASYRRFLASRPPEAELHAIVGLTRLARMTGCRLHVVHLSSAAALPTLAAARAEGIEISVETCPHYLAFSAEEIPAGATQFKCCPPIRDAANRDLLWEGLENGTIDLVVSDHSPSSLDRKALDTGDFAAAWGGISSLQLGLAAVWTAGRARGVALADVSRWMSAAPASMTGLRRKGSLAAGYDADFVVFAPDERFVIDASTLHHRHALTPYDGWTLSGVVRETWLRGEPVDLAGEPRGRLLTR